MRKDLERTGAYSTTKTMARVQVRLITSLESQKTTTEDLLTSLSNGQ